MNLEILKKLIEKKIKENLYTDEYTLNLRNILKLLYCQGSMKIM